MKPHEIERLEIILDQEVANIHQGAHAYVFRESIDYLGRMSEAYCQIDAVFDEHPSGDLPLEQAEIAYDNFQYIAALALAQLTFLKSTHRTLGVV